MTIKSTHTNLTTRGIVVAAIPFQERRQITTVFTPDYGLIGLLVPNQKRRKGSIPISTLLEAEFTIKEGRGQLYRCLEVSRTCHRVELRQDLDILKSALALLDVIRRTQQPNRGSPLVYKLLIKYLDTISKATDPKSFLASFRLKILKHEGLLNLINSCSVCENPVRHLGADGLYCGAHGQRGHLPVSDAELETLQKLTETRSSNYLINIKTDPSLIKKTEQLFHFHH